MKFAINEDFELKAEYDECEPVADGTSGAKLCDICYDSYMQKHMLRIESCEDHEFCRRCYTDYLQEKICNGTLDLTCMQAGCDKCFNE